MRKWIAALLAALLLVGGAVTAWAAQKWFLPGYNSFSIENNIGHLGTLKTSALNASQRAFMEEWLSSDKALLYWRYQDYKSMGYFEFIILDGYTGPSSLTYSNGALQINCALRGLSWSATSNATVNGSVYSMARLTNTEASDRGLGGIIATNFDFDSSCNDWYMNLDYVLITDDDGLFRPDTPDPSEPDPPPLPPPTSLPDVPVVKSDYVPYDTSKWGDFRSWILARAGAATTIGWLVLGFLFSILLVIKVVKRFSRG